VMTVLLIALVVIAIIWLVRWSQARRTLLPTDARGGNSVREILDRRLAAGEIDELEYRRLRETLDAQAGRAREYGDALGSVRQRGGDDHASRDRVVGRPGPT
jgi:hypothetical protein